MKEKLGKDRTCGGCGKVGKERLTGVGEATQWACSSECAVKVIKQGDWGTLGWIKPS